MITPEDWARIVSASVVPVVIISACGLLCLTFYNRLAHIVSRLRAFQRERLKIQEDYARARFTGHADQLIIDRHRRLLEMLEHQNARVTRQARLVRMTLYCLIGTIASLTVCSLLTGLAVLMPTAKYLAAATFVAGMGMLLAGTVPAFIDLTTALESVELESQFVSQLEEDFENALTERDRTNGG